MKNFVDYIEEELKGVPDSESLYRYKKELLDKMTERANEITHSGLSDEKVIADLIRSEFPDLKGGYREYTSKIHAKKKSKANAKILTLSSIAFVLLLVIVYLGISFLTHLWSLTWLILVGGIFAMLVALFGVSIKKISAKKGKYHFGARILLALSILLTSTFLFLCLLFFTHLPKTWLIFLFAAAAVFIADGAFAAYTKQKLAIINYLIYLPIVTTLFYVIFGIIGILPWHPGWMLILLSVFADLAIIVSNVIKNSKYIYRQEVEDTWEEN